MAKSDLIKDAIADKTKELIRNYSIEDITVTQICENAGLNRRTFYRYFRDKFEVVDWIYYRDELMHVEHYEGWSIFDYMPRIMQSLYNDRKYYINALKYKGQNSFRDFCTECLSKLIYPDFADVFATEWQLQFFIHNLCEMTYDACIDWLSEEPCISPQQFSSAYSDFLARAFTVSSRLLLRVPESRKRGISISHTEPSKGSQKHG